MVLGLKLYAFPQLSRLPTLFWPSAQFSGSQRFARILRAARDHCCLSLRLTSSCSMSAMAAPVLSFWERNPPLAPLLAAKLGGTSVQAVADPKATKDTIATLSFSSGDELVGTPMILRYFARASTKENLYGQSPLDACQVDYWLDFSTSIVSGSSFDSTCSSINDYLSLRSFLVGYSLTAADLAVWGQLQACPLWKKVKTSGKVPHLSRWFDFCSEVPEAKAVVSELDSKKKPATTEADAKKGGGDTGSFDIGLPGAEIGKVVTRFPPEPSGYLHVGHAKAALLNQHFADMYKGKLIVRFDDTNPSKEKDEFVENIMKDIGDLGLKYDRLTYTSDYFPQLLELAEKLIKAGEMYADDTPVEKMREERFDGTESKCRNRSVEENLKIWQEMQAGTEVGLANCMRIKMDMKAANKCLRDPVAYRCNLTHHWRTGHKYKMYPTYDFACPFVDAIEGVTHALRTSEYRDREAQYYWILKLQQKVWPGLPNVHIWDYSRLNFVNTVLSKRKLTWFVETNRVEGWNDPRMPTVQGILRRGLQIEALREFILSQGASKNVTFQEWDKIWAINKKVVDPVCPRFTAIEVDGKVPVTMTNVGEEPEVLTVLRHKKHPPAGKKTLTRSKRFLIEQVDARELKDGEEVTLMDWGNAFIRKITKDGDVITSMEMEFNPAGDVKKTKWKLTWLSQAVDAVELCLVDFDYLINKKKVEEDDDFMTLVNETTKFEKLALGDPNTRSLQKGDVLQLERKGYYVVDEPFTRAGKPLVLFTIPDGRSKSVAAK